MNIYIDHIDQTEVIEGLFALSQGQLVNFHISGPDLREDFVDAEIFTQGRIVYGGLRRSYSFFALKTAVCLGGGAYKKDYSPSIRRLLIDCHDNGWLIAYDNGKPYTEDTIIEISDIKTFKFM